MLLAFSGGALFGERHGIGPPSVLALHGWGENRHQLAPALRQFNAIALDLPGFGASHEPAEPTDGAGYAALLEPVLAEMAGPVTVLGFGFGGRLAVRLGAAYPHRVGALVLSAAPLARPGGAAPPEPDRAFRLARWRHERNLLSADGLERSRRRHGSADYRAARGVMRDLLVSVVNETYGDDLRRLAVPVELVWGEMDKVVPPAVMGFAAELLAAGPAILRTEVVPAAKHDLPTKAPQHLAAAVERAETALGR